MVLRFALALAAIAILTVLGLKGFQQGRSVGSEQEKDSLVEVARRKKAEGQDKGTVSEMRIDYAGANMTLEEALKSFSVVIAEPIESKGFALDSTNIRTWYRFRILETLARKSYWYCSTCSPIPAVPPEMGKPNYDEFFVNVIGGVLNIEGVEITQRNSSLLFNQGTGT